jgi:hypothetical protein
MRQVKQLGVLLFILMFVAGCATTGTTTLTPKQQATIFMEVYNASYDNAMTVMKNPASTPEQKEMALKKKDILTKVWPLLKVYVSTVEGGGTPSATDTATIISLIDQLTALTGGQ